MADYSNEIRQHVDMVFEKAQLIYSRAKQSQDAGTINQAVTDLKQCSNEIEQTINGYNNRFNTSANSAALAYARDKIRIISGWIAELQQINTVANHGSLDSVTGEFADDRTQGWVPTTGSPNVSNAANIGDILVWLKGIYNQNSSNAQNAAYLDAIIELLSGLQSQQWQQASDDLAYYRTNYNTLIAQYMASGMSRAAAMQAASGSMPTVAGSSVGALGSDILGGVAADQQAAIGQRANDINAAAQSTNAFAATNAVWQKQQELEGVLANLNAQTNAINYDTNYMKSAREKFSKTLEAFYSLAGNHVDMPFEATVNIDAFTKYVSQQADFLSQISTAVENGDAFYYNGRLYASTVSKYGKDNVPDDSMLLYDEQALSQFKAFGALNTNLTENLGDSGFHDLFSQFFFGTEGPRFYFQHQAQMQMDQNKAYLNDLQTTLQSLETKLASDELTAAANSAFYSAFALADVEQQSKWNDNIIKAGLSWSNGQLVKLSIDENGNQIEVPATYDELEKAGLISIGLTFDQRQTMMARLRALLLDNNATHFQWNLENMLLKDENDNAFLTLQGMGARKAKNWVSNTSVWQDIAGATELIKMTGLGAASAAAFRVGVGIATGTSSLMSSISKLRSASTPDNYVSNYYITPPRQSSVDRNVDIMPK